MPSTLPPTSNDPAVADRKPLFVAVLAGLMVVIIFATVAVVEIFDERGRILAEAERSTANLAPHPRRAQPIDVRGDALLARLGEELCQPHARGASGRQRADAEPAPPARRRDAVSS